MGQLKACFQTMKIVPNPQHFLSSLIKTSFRKCLLLIKWKMLIDQHRRIKVYWLWLKLSNLLTLNERSTVLDMWLILTGIVACLKVWMKLSNLFCVQLQIENLMYLFSKSTAIHPYIFIIFKHLFSYSTVYELVLMSSFFLFINTKSQLQCEHKTKIYICKAFLVRKQ